MTPEPLNTVLPGRVLVVDDDEMIRLLARMTLDVKRNSTSYS